MTDLAAVADKLHESLALLPPDKYHQVSATWTTTAGMLLTLSLSSTSPNEDEDEVRP
jgi:hypothetical protein